MISDFFNSLPFDITSLSVTPYSGMSFWLFLILFIFGCQLLRSFGNKNAVVDVFMITASCLIIGLVQGDNKYYIILTLISLSVLVYFTGKIVSSHSSQTKKQTINISVVVLVVLFLCYYKYSLFQSTVNSLWEQVSSSFMSTEKHIFFLGVSYFSFKFIHFLVDCYNNKIKDFNLLTFINYTLFFPSFFSGPINRYITFSENIVHHERSNLSDYIAGTKRIINGLFKKVVLAGSLAPYIVSSLDFSDPSTTPARAILGVYAYMFYIYFDFSGYSDMAIGAGRLAGIHLPENFNYPFTKRNLQQFWANWHMSLTTWLTDYIYWPVARKIRNLSLIKRRPVATSNICIILTFMVCGLWHGDGLNFFLWGLYHGIGLAILKVYEQIVKKKFPQPLKVFIHKSPVAYWFSTFITFQYVAFGFLLFACTLSQQMTFFRLILG